MKLVVVSGASRGIGLEFASQLLRRSQDTHVVAASRSGADSPGIAGLQAEFPERLAAIECDVTRPDHISQLGHRVKELHADKKVDLLLNVAGLLHDAGGSGYMPERSLSTIDADAMSRVLATNAIGPVLVSQALASRMNRGAIVGNLSARVGSISDNRLGGWWSYRMSKAALNMATVNMALELKRREVYAVALHPGTTDTSLSVPFQKNVRPEKLFTTEYTVSSLLSVLDGLQPEDTGGFFAFDGSRIEF